MARQNTFNRMMKFMLTLCGVWPGATCVLFCRILLIVLMTIALYCNYRYFMTHIHSTQLLNLMDLMSLVLAHCKVVAKCLVFWLNQRKFMEVLTMMEADWNDCVNNDVSMRETASRARTSHRIINTIFIFHTMSVVGYSISIILADVDVTANATELPFLTKIEVPFNINTQYTYRFILMIELFFVFICSWSSGTINALLLTLTLHTAGQIDILRYWLMHLAPRKDKNKDESITIETNKIIQKHQRIIKFSENIESLYTYIALAQFVSNTIMICSLGFLIVMAIGSPNATEQIVRSLFFYTITNLEAYIFCFSGEYMKNKSNEIGSAAYDSAWYNMKSKNSYTLLFVIIRSQKQLTLTAGKMIDLSMQSFTSIMNASGSYLSVLLAMQ